MNAEPIHRITLSAPLYQALLLLARIDRTTPQELAEVIIASYMEGRLEDIHKAHHEPEIKRGRGQVIDLASRRYQRR